MSIIKKMTAVFLAVVMCIFLMPTADAAGSTLSCNTYNGTINVGKSGALLITATGNKTLSAGVSDSNVLSYKWDTKWTTDTSIKLIITGKKAGTSKVYIKNGNSEMITVNITVKSDNTTVSYGSTSKLIKADKYKVSVNTGNKSAVKVTSSDHSLMYKVGDPSIASVSVGKWSGNNIKFTVKGKKAGTTYLTVYRKNNKNVAVNIKITVVKQAASVNTTTTVQVPSTQIKPETDSSVTSTETASDSFAEQMLALVNQARAEAGVAPLTLDSKLCDAADKRAVEITSYFSHTRPNGSDCFTIFDEFGISCWGGGENIAMGSSDAQTIFNMWMNSPGHRANILKSSFTTIGIGKSGVYWVQLFLM